MEDTVTDPHSLSQDAGSDRGVCGPWGARPTDSSLLNTQMLGFLWKGPSVETGRAFYSDHLSVGRCAYGQSEQHRIQLTSHWMCEQEDRGDLNMQIQPHSWLFSVNSHWTSNEMWVYRCILHPTLYVIQIYLDITAQGLVIPWLIHIYYVQVRF